MISGMATLLGFQLAGELAARLGQLPVSGPLFGMGALLVWLHVRGEISDDLTKVCDGILANMALLFVPVGVGAMRYSGLFAGNWYVIVLAILLGACVTLLTTAYVARALVSWSSRRVPEAKNQGTWPTT
jgi:holin-like protein